MNNFDEIRKIIRSKREFEGFVCFRVKIIRQNDYMEMFFALRFWPQYQTYIAVPVVHRDNDYFYAHIRIEKVWHYALRWYLRKHLGVRHLHWVNDVDNSARINKLLKLQTV